MKREAELKRRLRSLQALNEAVSAMKSLSAHHFRQARGAVEPARIYRAGVERVLAGSGARLDAGDGPAGLLIVGAELGLCGAYNSQVVAFGAKHRAELGAGPTLCVGHRAASLLARLGVEVGDVYPGPTSVRGITELLLQLAEKILGQYVTQRWSGFDIVASRFGGVGQAQPQGVRLLPLRAQPKEHPPGARYVSPTQLGSASIREFLYITLYDLLLDALACEHSARLLATQAAEQWLQQRSRRLQRHLAATRRENSTQEMLEIATGARARRRSGGTPVSG